MDILQGDCLRVLKRMAAGFFDGCLCDPPYGLTANKKGGSGVASMSTKTPHGRSRMGAGNGSGGFMGMPWDAGIPPVDVWTEVLRVLKPGAFLLAFGGTRTYHRLACAIEDAGFEIRDCIMWLYGSGFPKHGSCLKPAWEPIIVARKSGKGLLNIDACRIGNETRISTPASTNRVQTMGRPQHSGSGWRADAVAHRVTGRWPANVILDEEAAAALDEQAIAANYRCARGDSAGMQRTTSKCWFGMADKSGDKMVGYGDGTPGASRFFYCAKASRKERGEGNTHPTVKPLKLTEYLARLILPPNSKNARLLVPFAGSGSEMIGAKRAGWKQITGIEREPAYVKLAQARFA